MRLNSPRMTVIYNACMKASKSLIRDFGEIEKLQVSTKGPGDFVTAADKRTEKIILEKMINNPGKTFSREDIGKLTDLDKERSIDVIITRLRKKIEIDPKNPKYLQTLRGAGYVLWIE